MSNLKHTTELEAEILQLKKDSALLQQCYNILYSGIMFNKSVIPMTIINMKQKLEKIENWYARTQGQVTHESALEMVQILKENKV